MKKYNLRNIMITAWKFYRKGISSFAMALRMAWSNAKIRNAAKATAQVTEEAHTWSGWKELGYEVKHESKAMFQAVIDDPATKSGKRIVSYFGISQVQPIPQT